MCSEAQPGHSHSTAQRSTALWRPLRGSSRIAERCGAVRRADPPRCLPSERYRMLEAGRKKVFSFTATCFLSILHDSSVGTLACWHAVRGPRAGVNHMCTPRPAPPRPAPPLPPPDVSSNPRNSWHLTWQALGTGRRSGGDRTFFHGGAGRSARAPTEHGVGQPARHARVVASRLPTTRASLRDAFRPKQSGKAGLLPAPLVSGVQSASGATRATPWAPGLRTPAAVRRGEAVAGGLWACVAVRRGASRPGTAPLSPWQTGRTWT